MGTSPVAAAVLDEPDHIAQFDPNGMFDILSGWPEQWQKAAGLVNNAQLPGAGGTGRFRNVVISGMGGSAIGGDLLNDYLSDSLTVPLSVSRSYTCPPYVSRDTLFVAVSYSGNTEETLSALKEALKRKAEVVAVTTGGALAEECGRAGRPVIPIPKGLPPRQALGYLFLPVLGVLERMGLAEGQKAAVEETKGLLAGWVQEYGPVVPHLENRAKTLAAALHKKVPVIYGVQGRTGAVASRWRGQFHENSKNWATSNVLPELDHNEITSWATLSDVTRRLVYLIFLEDSEDGQRMERRREITRKLIEPDVSGAISIRSSGESRLARLFSLIVLGDFVSCYLAVLNGVDPLPVSVIEDLKKELAETQPTE